MLEAELYDVLVEGLWPLDRVVCQYQPELCSPRFSSAELREIDRLWLGRSREAKATGTWLYNSELFSLPGSELAAGDGGNLTLRLGATDYRTYVATRQPILSPPLKCRADPVGTCMIPVTSDGYVVLARRSPLADANPGRYFTFGGFFDRALDVGEQGDPSITQCLIRELTEETSLIMPPSAFACLGVVYDRVHCHPELIAFLRLDAPHDALPNLIPRPDDAEFSSLDLVHHEQLDSFLNEQRSEVTASLLGGLRMYERLRAEIGTHELGANGAAWRPT